MSTVSEPVSLSTPRGVDAGLTPKQLAEKYGLAVSGARPGLVAYTKQLWARRHFIWAFATARLVAQYTDAKLGQLWQVVTPLLNCAVFYLVFGVILASKQGFPDNTYIAWLCIGVFVFQFTQNAVQSGTRAISDNLGLIRALHFPRASLPIAFTVIQLQQLMISMVVLVVTVLAAGVTPGRTWLLIIPALLLQTLFNTGVSLVMARIGAKTSDISQLIPFVMRAWMFLSGVMFSIQDKIQTWPHYIQTLMSLNPATIYMDLLRHAFAPVIYNPHQPVHQNFPPHQWAYALVWGVGMFVVGYVFFWKAEEEYGRG
ncbi:ABC transporter permease [Streptomyces sp. CBMA156]|uniref:ABC transporter permease n=1 Tax=Streptomyces sp. CBMA156 TaxID=1930280 RepID=UPI00166200EF|nr:ABC transporter permease [Streptomyces sp. CBMA156]MBD0672078.1 ABC transporter [Streptomyces sp. CBMA156]MBD0672173.1 ABC transporter [Streptomyces sp. CBMA156]